MIGDWVLYRPGWIDDNTKTPVYESESGFPVRLTCIYGELAQYDDVLPDGTINTIEVADFELFPIPLTKEILIKNGWCEESDYENDLYGGHFPEDKQHRLELDIDGSEVWWTINRAENYIIQLRYVHELQHALKLCGIDKEITL